MSPMVSRPLTNEFALLGYLRQGPQHGYEIHQRHMAPDGLGRIWWLKQSQLYALLGKLEEAGYLSASIQPQEVRPARRVFRLTERGEAAFRTWLAHPVERPRQMRTEFQLKLYFARQEGDELCARLIDAQRQACQEWLAEQIATADEDTAEHLWLLDCYRIGQIQAILDWLDRCRERLD